MFGIVRPCQHRLRGPLFGQWIAHLCGLCLTLRDLHGQRARLVTNYDGLLVSVLTEAQNPMVAPHRRAGPCALRGLRRADVLDAAGEGARLAASVSLVLAAGKVRDHVTDGDGAYARRLVARGGGALAARWQTAGERTGVGIGFDTAVLTGAISRQAEIERTAGLSLLDVTEPTETAVSAAFAHTATLAGRPGNAEPLAEAGRHFGRIVHLLDAVEDLPADRANGLYNPLLATGTTTDDGQARCEEALTDLRAAVAALELDERTLTDALLMREVGIAVDRVFAGPGGAIRLAAGSLPCLQFGSGTPRRRGRRWERCTDFCDDCCCCCDCCDCAC
jgi:post-segregation antitoxin (ccd killing protein)